MDIFSGLTDDEIALIGCVAALLTTGAIMWLSYFAGRAVRHEQAQRHASFRFGRTAPAQQPSFASGDSTEKAA